MIFALGEMGEAKCNGETWMNLKSITLSPVFHPHYPRQTVSTKVFFLIFILYWTIVDLQSHSLQLMKNCMFNVEEPYVYV